MKFSFLVRMAAIGLTLPVIAAAQSPGQGSANQPAATGAVPSTKIAVIDIDRVAAESNAGKALFEKLKAENDKIAAERAKREQEIRDLTAKMNSEILSSEARDRLAREIERKRTDASRWLEDQQREFELKQQEGEQEFQKLLAPVVEKVARENGIGLILRATPGLTFVLDPSLDITPAVVQALNQSGAKPGDAPGSNSRE